MDTTTTAARIIDTLKLEPLAVCHGYFRETWRDSHSTVIYWLLPAEHFAGLHATAYPEVFTYHSGAPLAMTLLDGDGRPVRHILGPDLDAGQRPHLVVPAGVWQAAHTLGDHTLSSVVVAPPFTPEAATVGDPDALARHYPEYAEEIRGLCADGRLP
ncbi:cupin domain-containing protein [Nocardia sp. NPDC051570]|uniref:cupin domain-containing protein n=1 Tax=Nocardia sp. NPDC051570 TaxID=3364324 RepID=UPI00379A0C7E